MWVGGGGDGHICDVIFERVPDFCDEMCHEGMGVKITPKSRDVIYGRLCGTVTYWKVLQFAALSAQGCLTRWERPVEKGKLMLAIGICCFCCWIRDGVV